MKLPRDEFIGRFAIPFHVHCLKLWSRRATAPPYSVARCCFEWIEITNGKVNLKAHDFAVVARPVIDELYRITRASDRMRMTLRLGSTTHSTRRGLRLRLVRRQERRRALRHPTNSLPEESCYRRPRGPRRDSPGLQASSTGLGNQ
jgi:hypothetical protein